MKSITIENFKSALTNAAAQSGARGVAHTKAVIFADCVIVDADGMPIDPATIDVVISPMAESAPVEASADATETKAAADMIAKSVRAEIRAAIEDNSMPVRRAIVTAGDDEKIPMYRGLKSFGTAREAYRFGRFIYAACGNQKSIDFCNKNGMSIKAHSEGNNANGGFLVPDEFESALITLREQFGVFRQNARIYPMGRDTLFVPRRTGTLTSYWVGETKAGTESTQTFDNVQLVAKKLMAITTTSTELNEDSIANIGDDLAREIAYEFAKREDEAGFNGDGTSTYGGVVGLANAVGTAGTSDSGISTSALSGISIATVHTWLSLLPAYAATPNTKIYCNKSVFHAVFERFTMAAGGATAIDFANGASPRFFGYPVVFSQAVSGVTGTGTDGVPIAYAGDLAMGCAFGDRRAVTIRTSDSALNAFEQDEIVIRGTQRVDINCHSVGDTTTAGAVVMLTR